jgi:hypothetical protein
MKPTKGRIVLFTSPLIEDEEEVAGGIDSYAAIVTDVNDDGTVDLVMFGSGSMYFQHDVEQEEKATAGSGKWSWPPREV